MSINTEVRPADAEGIARAAELLRQGELVALPTYTANTPGGPVAWQNTNRLLDPESPYYHPRAAGVKTGTLEGCCNLVALYQSSQEAVLVCLLGAATDEVRYQEALRVFAALDSALAPASG